MILALSFLAGVLYRLGGKYQTKIRDFGVPVIMCVAMLSMGHAHWSLVLCFGSLFGSLTTYWKKKRTDAKWYNWAITGLFYGLSMLPYAIFTGHYLGFAVRSLVLAVLVMVWSLSIGRDWLEEWGRGFLIISTLLLLK